MFFPFVLLAVSVICFIHKHHGEPAPDKNAFPEDLPTWCPHTKFCNIEPATPTPHTESQDNVKPCCDQCSCSPSCGLTRSCCTYDYDAYKLDETLDTVCKALNNRDETSPGDVIYHMVDKCPNKDISCNTVNVSTWGSFSPVYSRSTGRIYYNSECAGCHSDTDSVDFIPILASPYFAGPYSKLFSNVLNGQEEEYFLEFLAPQGIDLTTEICYPSMIRTCKQPEASNYHLFKDLCESFNATFYIRSIAYQNVYCYLCARYDLLPKERWLEAHGMCPAKNTKRTFGRYPLVVLLDKGSISNFKMAVEEGTTKHVCIGENSPEVQACRPLFCPEGHFRVKGECVLFGRTWYIQHGRVYINITLTSDTDTLLISDLTEETTEELVSQIETYIQEPNLNEWNMELFYNEDDNGTIIRYIVAQLSISYQTVKAQTLLEDVRRSLQSKQDLYIADKTFGLKADFTNYINYEWYGEKLSSGPPGRGAIFSRSGIVNEDGWRFSSSDLQSEVGADFYMISLTNISRKGMAQNDVCITELFYCEQVDLQQSEFKMISLAEAYLIHQRKHLGDGRFAVTIRSGQTHELRVCLSDIVEDSASTMEKHFVVHVLVFLGLYVVM